MRYKGLDHFPDLPTLHSKLKSTILIWTPSTFSLFVSVPLVSHPLISQLC